MSWLLLYELCDCVFHPECIHRDAFTMELQASNSHRFEAMGWVFDHIAELAET